MFALRAAQDLMFRVRSGIEPACAKAHFYDLVDQDMDGKEVPMSQFKGDVLLLVNVASK